MGVAQKVMPASGLYAFLEVGRRKEHVRLLLLSHTMNGIIVRELPVKRTFSEIVLRRSKTNVRET